MLKANARVGVDGQTKGKEKAIVEKALSNFDCYKSNTWAALIAQFSSGIRHTELLSIAQIVEKITQVPKFGRNEKRSFACLVKWFDDNWNNISKVIGRISLLDDNNIEICGRREIADFTRS